MKTIGTLIMLMLSLSMAQATHFWGGDITYECLGSNVYRIYHTAYYDCYGAAAQSFLPIGQGTPPPTPTLSFTAPAPGCTQPTAMGAWSTPSIRDVAPLCPILLDSSSCRVTNPGAQTFPGVLAVTYYRDYDFSAVTCTTLTVSQSTCCRGTTITNLNSAQSSSILIGNVEIDLSLGCNSSPEFADDAPFYICDTRTTEHFLGAVDPDGDSLSYHLSPCFEDLNDTVVYLTSMGYSSTQPLGPNWQVDLNSQTGVMTFTPNPGGPEVASVCMRVDEYRNGNLIGSVYRDMLFTVVGCQTANSFAPYLQGLQLTGGTLDSTSGIVAGYIGDTLKLSVAFADSNLTDTLVYETLGQSLPGASFSVSGSNPLTVDIIWPVDPVYQSLQFPVMLQVEDNSCPFVQRMILPLQFTAVAPELDYVAVAPSCGNNDGSIDVTVLSGVAPYNFAWSHGPTTEDVSNLAAGIYTLTVTDANGLSFTRQIVLNNSNIQVSKTILTPGCQTDSGSVALSISGGVPPYRILWNTQDTTSQIQNLGPGGYSFTILDSNDCQYHEAFILNRPTACQASISGQAFVDLNGNCAADVGEPLASNVLVDIFPGGRELTDTAGQYSFDVPVSVAQTYLLSTLPGATYQAQCVNTPPYIYTIPVTSTFAGEDSLDVAVLFNASSDLRVELSGLPLFLTGISQCHFATVVNQSNATFTGDISITYSPAFKPQSFVPAPTTWDSVLRIATWNLPTLLPGGTFNIKINSKNATATIGDTIQIVAAVTPNPMDSILTNNTDTLKGTQRGAYDPNIKVADPLGEGTEGFILPTEYDHTYTVLFQNTGNWPATYVTIRDTLSGNFNMATLLPLSSTHPYSLRIEEDSILVFQFDNINLPDSTSDPEGSIGQVSYAVKHQFGLPVGTKLTNEAGIYFDFNPPIFTPVALNTLQDKTTNLDGTLFPFKAYPNPAQDRIYLAELPSETVVRLLDMRGKQVRNITLNPGNQSLSVAGLTPGIYFLELQTQEGVWRKKWLLRE